MQPGDLMTMMSQMEARGKWRGQRTHRIQRMQKLTADPMLQGLGRVAEETTSKDDGASKSRAKPYNAPGAQRGPTRCNWRGKDKGGNIYKCVNWQFRDPTTRQLHPTCPFHITQCTASHPHGIERIAYPNALALCVMHYSTIYGQEPVSYAGELYVPGVTLSHVARTRHPLAPTSPPTHVRNGNEDAEGEGKDENDGTLDAAFSTAADAARVRDGKEEDDDDDDEEEAELGDEWKVPIEDRVVRKFMEWGSAARERAKERMERAQQERAVHAKLLAAKKKEADAEKVARDADPTVQAARAARYAKAPTVVKAVIRMKANMRKLLTKRQLSEQERIERKYADRKALPGYSAAAIKIQAAVRRLHARRTAERITVATLRLRRDDAARVLQRTFAKVVATKRFRNHYFRSHNAACIIQRAFRYWKLHVNLDEDRRNHAAAVRIQRWFRVKRFKADLRLLHERAIAQSLSIIWTYAVKKIRGMVLQWRLRRIVRAVMA
ncbi:hypothetical protein EON66_00575, partial [archaeon]